MLKHLNLKIFGRVQGVFFRDTACEVARELGLKGFVRNESDGTVYAEIEGDSKLLDEFVKWSKQGSKMAKVEKVESTSSDLVGFDNFKMVYS